MASACPCRRGEHQVCDHQTQPGFTHWGSFAELVVVRHADVNLVALPESIADVTAASLGCRFATAFRAVVDQGRVAPGEWVAVHGAGGVGLSAVMIARAMGARVIAVDRDVAALERAAALGAESAIDAATVPEIAEAIHELTGGGADLSSTRSAPPSRHTTRSPASARTAVTCRWGSWWATTTSRHCRWSW